MAENIPTTVPPFVEPFLSERPDGIHDLICWYRRPATDEEAAEIRMDNCDVFADTWYTADLSRPSSSTVSRSALLPSTLTFSLCASNVIGITARLRVISGVRM